ncbi:FliI/YscN family ATPase [Aliisedimentitalea scapharcae]|uniref:FliI/YscN family ATPase n=1 Tax=Aliisedimentitalea scapharcae TaxID=1524259 RepID=A0ABZ2XSM6_9RHOB
MNETLRMLRNVVASKPLARPVGRVVAVQGGSIKLSGLAQDACIGDLLELKRLNGTTLNGEVIQIEDETVFMLPETTPEKVAVGDPAALSPVPDFAPCGQWIGRMIDPFGRPLDGRPLGPGAMSHDVLAPPPQAAKRKPLGDRLATGLAVLNTILPIVRGQRIGLFAGSGVGKSRLLSSLANGMQADVVVIALIGERGREVNEFVHRVLGPEGMKRSIIVVATSDQPATTRRRCAWAAMAVAEHFRDQGQNVLFLADSVTRFAEAHREISTLSGEVPALRGYPPSLSPLLTALCERAGPGSNGQGDITAVFSVLVAGSDMEEPVADILRGTLDGHILLDRSIAERGRFPAIDVARSVSRSLPDAATEKENVLISETRKLLGAYEQSEVMIKAGLYQAGTDIKLDQAVQIWDELDAFFAKSDDVGISNSFDRLSVILRRAGIQPASR